MRKFIIRFFRFLLFVALVLTVVIVYCCYRLNRDSIYRLDPSVKYLIVGDSHTQCALDDNAFPGALNLSNSADSYLYSYLKVRRLLNYNHQVKTILLGYSGHNLSPVMDDWNFRDENLRNKTSQYLPLMGWGDVTFLASRRPASFLSGAVKFPKVKFNVLRNIDDDTRITDIGIGGYERLTNLIQDWKGLSKADSTGYRKSGQYSESQILYLKKIISVCQRHQVRLILISTPLHHSYPDKGDRGDQPDSIYYTQELSGLKWLKFNRFALSDSCYADFEHLNQQGAQAFTRMIRDQLGPDLQPN